jgi:hypothetical protein
MTQYIKKLQKRTYHNAVTNWEPPNSKFYSQWGEVTYLDWCHKESKRMNSVGASTIVCEEPEGLVAICRS